MATDVYRYRFGKNVSADEIEATLLLAIVAAEGVHGQAQVRLYMSHAFDGAAGTCVIDAGTPVGRDVNKLFVSFLAREFGADAFTVERVPDPAFDARGPAFDARP
jgi:hypothetical protein